MKTFMKIFPVIVLLVVLSVSCKKDEATVTTAMLNLNLSGLEDLGANARYEGWIMVSGSPVSTGVFTVNSTGQLSKTAFTVDKQQLQNATAFILTVEPYPDPSTAPSDVHLLGGDFSASNATLSIAHSGALNNDFSTATGNYVLATPTTASTTDELSGLWFLSLASGTPAAGLSLPVLPSGWRYEGWAVINSKPVSTGMFTTVSSADGAAPYSGASPGPPFPGEDFVANAPSGFTFPTNLSGGKAVISIEPYPDNSSAPFLLKPLMATIPTAAADHVTYSMNLNAASFPTGTAVRN